MFSLARRETLVHIAVTGRHRARFLHAMTTADVKNLAPGSCAFALVATANGRHVGQLRLEVRDDVIDLTTEAGSLARIIDTLKRHKVADDVRFGEVVPGETTFALYDEDPTHSTTAALAETVSNARLTSPALAAFTVSRWEPAASELGRPTLHLRGAEADAAAAIDALLGAGGVWLGPEAWERRRIEQTWPADTTDLGPEDMALYSERLLATVSWVKGCFLGQEVFVMARDRGEIPKHLRRIETPPDTSLTPGETLFADGKPAGVVGSVVPGLALAVLKRKYAAAGQALGREGETSASVRVS